MQKATILQFLMFSLTAFAFLVHGNNSFVVSHPTAMGILKGQEFKLIINNDESGKLCFVKIPLTKWYILYDFYIEKNYRNQGYGKKLFQKVLNEVAQDATKIFIQPGPFELVDGRMLTLPTDEREDRIIKLVKFYESFNFHVSNNRYGCSLLGIVYKALGIPEDPHYFMIRD